MNSTIRRRRGLIALLCLTGIAISPVPQALSGSASQDSPNSVRGLSVTNQAANVLLSWPSNPHESFLVLVRSNPVPEGHWTVLTNHMPAAAVNRTAFLDPDGASRSRIGSSNSPLADYYCVLLIPDFWFNPAGAVLDGGPRKTGADFLPVYTGTSETDEFNRPFNLHVEMLLDAERASEEEAIDLRSAVEDGIERVNLGSAQHPIWAQSAGFWLEHNQLTNGFHTLRLQTLLRLNTLVGPGEQFLILTNRPVTVTTANRPTGPAAESWWVKRLGPRFIRRKPSDGVQSPSGPRVTPNTKLIARPLDVSTR